MEPLTYKKKIYNKFAIFYKVKKSLKENCFAKISCASFICTDITNVLEISNEFILDLLNLLSLDEEEINEYMVLK